MTDPQAVQDMLEEYYMTCRDHGAMIAWQMGDAFEFYFDSAEKVAALLGLAVGTRGQRPDGRPVPMCAVPADARFSVQGDCLLVPLVPTDHAFGKLVRAGYALAVALYAPEPERPHRRRVVAVIYPETHSNPKVGDWLTILCKAPTVWATN